VCLCVDVCVCVFVVCVGICLFVFVFYICVYLFGVFVMCVCKFVYCVCLFVLCVFVILFLCFFNVLSHHTPLQNNNSCSILYLATYFYVYLSLVNFTDLRNFLKPLRVCHYFIFCGVPGPTSGRYEFYHVTSVVFQCTA